MGFGGELLRLIHQLSLSEVTVALIVFDARSETDPFSGVRYWNRALRQSLKGGDGKRTVRKFLVAARTDRGGVNVSRARVDALLNELECDGYFETSAKEGREIERLGKAIREAINWSSAPKVSSTELFHVIKSFLLAKKEEGTFLASLDELYGSFVETQKQTASVELMNQFRDLRGTGGSARADSAIELWEAGVIAAGVFGCVRVGDCECRAGRSGRDGLDCGRGGTEGSIFHSTGGAAAGLGQEELLLIATVEELLRHELAIREEVNGTSYLVLPSQFTREWPVAGPILRGKRRSSRLKGRL